MNSEYVLNILQERQLITDEQANTVRSQVADSSKDVAQLIVDTGAIDRNTIFYYVAESLGLDHVDLKGIPHQLKLFLQFLPLRRGFIKLFQSHMMVIP